MTSQPNPKVDWYFDEADGWPAECRRLRAICLDCDLVEALKWGHPCYTLQGKNVVLIHGFKDYCALLFVKGALLADESGVLVQQTANVQAGRQMRFTGLDEIVRRENVVTSYIHEAIAVETSGRQVAKKTTADFPVPEELAMRLAGDPALKAAFEALTPGRQRGYLLHFGSAKQAKTREARIDKAAPQILAGKGLDD